MSNKIENGWFVEKNPFWAGQAMSLEVEEILFEGKSDFQDVMVFKSKSYGKVLVLDGVIQITERDEFSYQEMLAHIPLCAHPNPKKVLAIGGGDGGILREVERHDTVEEITLCEIDKLVVDLAKKYFPTFAVGFDDPRVRVVIDDGCKFVAQKTEEYDVIIVDSSDPIGPASVLFEHPFYAAMRRALRPGGIVCTQAECQWLHLDLIKNLVEASRQVYPHVAYAYTTIPTYPCGQIGFCVCSLRDEPPTKPVRKVPKEDELRYYNSRVHAAAFVLPQFASKVIKNPGME